MHGEIEDPVLDAAANPHPQVRSAARLIWSQSGGSTYGASEPAKLRSSLAAYSWPATKVPSPAGGSIQHSFCSTLLDGTAP